jgi:acyl dehydratase
MSDSPLTFASIDALRAGVGSVAVSTPFEISQTTIDAFARLTHDPQWIHVDVERAKRESPFETTIAHGFLTLSMLSAMIESAVRFPPVRSTINYGFNKVRFVAPVPAGSTIVGRFTLASIEPGDGFLSMVWDATVSLAGSNAVVLAAQWLSRVYP